MSHIGTRPISSNESSVLSSLINLGISGVSQGIAKTSSTTFENVTFSGGGGSGTVTSVSVTTANGVSGTVATATTTPAISITLGDITPTTVTTTGKIGIGGAITSDYLATFNGDSTSDNSRILNIVQGNDTAEDTYATYITNTVNPGAVTGGNRSMINNYVTFTPTFSSANATALAYVNKNDISLSNVTLGNSNADVNDIAFYGADYSFSGTPVINNTNADAESSTLTVIGSRVSISLTPTLTSITDVATTYYGYLATVSVTSAGNAALVNTIYGSFVTATGNLSTTGATSHFGYRATVSGTADTNYGLFLNVSGATDNYAIGIQAGLSGFNGVIAPAAGVHIGAGTTSAAPLKFNSGSLLATPQAGTMEFLTDSYYVTTTTNTIRRMLVAGNAGRAAGQTAAVASVATYTLGVADASFEISANVLVTTSSGEAFRVDVDYTDESNTARTLTLNFQLLGGTINTAIASANGAVPYEGIPAHIRCKASTAITIKTAGVFTGCTYNIEGVIKQIA